MMLSMNILTQYVNQDSLTESSIYQLDVIETGYESINEDSANNDIVQMTLSYTRSFILEILDNTKDALLKLYQRVLSVLNNYILNTANLADKYRNLIKERYKKLSSPMVIKTYEWPNLRNNSYPAIIRSDNELHAELEEVSQKVMDQNVNSDVIDTIVEKKIISFSKVVIDGTVDSSNLKETTKSIVTDRVRGRPVSRVLKYDELDKFIDEIKQYKVLKDDINRTKTAMLKDYEILKKSYMESINKKESQVVDVKALKNPGLEQFKSYEYQRFASINMHMNRLFNAYITIYNTAFDIKLNLLKEKIDSNRDILVDIMTRTSIIAAVNTKSPNKQRAPLKVSPITSR